MKGQCSRSACLRLRLQIDRQNSTRVFENYRYLDFVVRPAPYCLSILNAYCVCVFFVFALFPHTSASRWSFGRTLAWILHHTACAYVMTIFSTFDGPNYVHGTIFQQCLPFTARKNRGQFIKNERKKQQQQLFRKTENIEKNTNILFVIDDE